MNTQNTKAPFVTPPDMEMEDLQGDFQSPIGFMRRPKKENPKGNKIAGIVRAAVEQPNKLKPGETQHWYPLEITVDQPDCEVETRTEDGKAGPLLKGVKAGTTVAVSETGAIKALATKVGHYAIIDYTGETEDIGKPSPMWVCNVKVSKAPVI